MNKVTETVPHTHGGTDAPECTTCRSQRNPWVTPLYTLRQHSNGIHTDCDRSTCDHWTGSNMRTYRVTIIVESLGVRDTVTVTAKDEWKARGVAMLTSTDPALARLRGEFVEYEVSDAL